MSVQGLEAASRPAGVGYAPPRRRPDHLVPVLDASQEFALRLMVLAWVAASVWFWLWWTSPLRGEWNPSRIIVTGFLAWLFAMGAYYSFFICRMTRPNPAIPVPDLRVAMVVTKAPSEPWHVVHRTLEAMLGQSYPHSYDVWLADEAPSASTLAWCEQHGVKVSSRIGVAAYHKPEWPRRTRCKEGNLAYFYDHFGYDRYDVVAQLDSDHVPATGYLAEMVRPFADPSVGYVAAPSVCDANAAVGWTVKGRLYRDAAMHGPVQAGCNSGWAPVCIGSHYAVRTAALRDAGGIGPELAEDYTTTLWLVSRGWTGVFSIDAEAHGDGPATLDAMITQERQWSHSLGVIASRWAPSRLRAAPLRARLRLGFSLAFYPLQAGILAAGCLVPSVALLSGVSWGSTTLAGFYGHLWPAGLLLTAVTAYLRRSGTLRPADAKLWSLDHTLFQLTRWPWTGWEFCKGVVGGWRRRSGAFSVTPKGDQVEAMPKPGYLFPSLALGGVPAVCVVAVPHPEQVLGMVVVATVQSLLYLGAVLAVAVPPLVRIRPVTLALRTLWLPLVAIAGLASLLTRLVLAAG